MSKHFSELTKETRTQSEKHGLEKLFSMMLAIRQQIMLRHSFENEKGNFMKYKMKCYQCDANMEYVEDKKLEALEWITMYCPNCGDQLVPNDNPDLEKEE